MEDFKKIDEWEVLTPTGWQEFDGVKKVKKQSSMTITYELPSGTLKKIICSKGHQLFIKRDSEKQFLFAELINPLTDSIAHKNGTSFCKIISIEEKRKDIDMYDLINVKNGYEYIANDVVNHNCAHIEGIDEMWLGIQPTLSCVSGDTLVLTSDGFIPIEEFHKGKSVGDYFDLAIEIYGKNGMEKTSKGYVSPESDTLIVETKHGHKVECTPIHPLYTLIKQSSFGEMVQSQNLKIGDRLRIEFGNEIFGKTQLDHHEAYKLGYKSIGEGRDKEIPESVLRGTKETMTSYLSGLFDGYGTINKFGLVISEKSEKILQQAHILLHNLGLMSIVKTIEYNPYCLWRLTVPTSFLEKFRDVVGTEVDKRLRELNASIKSYVQHESLEKMKILPAPYLKAGIEHILDKVFKTKYWFKKNGFTLEPVLDTKRNKKFVTQEWLASLKTFVETEVPWNKWNHMESHDYDFFNEHIGSFYWDEIVSIKRSQNKTYDFTVPETHSFLQNGILGSNTGGSVILISSPSGVGTLFHRLWVGAQNQTNDFYPIELPWTVHPERDEKWFEKESRALFEAKGQRGISQELLCSFQSSGNTFLNGDAMDWLFKSIVDPIEKIPHGRYNTWVWERPQPGNKYVIVADVARGDAEDFSSFHVIDTDNRSVVADFKGKQPPDEFARLLVSYAKNYNNALLCQELNNVGVACAQTLKDSGYQNLYYEKFQKNIYMTYATTDLKPTDYPGFTMSQPMREQSLSRLENDLRNKNLLLRSKRLFEEFQTFIWKGQKPQAQKGHNDDMIMALAIGCHLIQFSGGAVNSEDAQWAMLAGMSRRDTEFNTLTGQSTEVRNAPNQTSDGFFSVPGNRSKQNPIRGAEHHKDNDDNKSALDKQIDRTNAKNLTQRKTHDYNNPQWDNFRWLFDD